MRRNNCVIRWIEIYQEDSVIRPFNNWRIILKEYIHFRRRKINRLLFTTYLKCEIRDGPLEKLWGGGEFSSRRNFFVIKFLVRLFFRP